MTLFNFFALKPAITNTNKVPANKWSRGPVICCRSLGGLFLCFGVVRKKLEQDCKSFLVFVVGLKVAKSIGRFLNYVVTVITTFFCVYCF